jgi:hypothetical protein
MGCGYDRSQQTKGDARLTPEDEEQPEPERLFAGLGRQLDAHWQMSDRSGPLYDLAKEHSRIVHDAYKAAGPPRKIYRSGMNGTLRRPIDVVQVRRGDTYQEEPATQVEVDAWWAWVRRREALRRSIGMRD